MKKEKNYSHLTIEQRYKMDALLKAGCSKKKITEQLGVHRSTVYREFKRNCTARKQYSALIANKFAQEKKERFKRHRKFSEPMKQFIKEKLMSQQWSPEQMSGYCKINSMPMVSHERIYQHIYQDQKQGGMLYKQLRIASKKNRKRYGTYDHRGKIPNRISIDMRPEMVNHRTRIGDWEVDTIIGKNHQGCMLTAVERKTLFTVIAKAKHKKSSLVTKQLINQLAPYKEVVHTITSDNGLEFIEHEKIARKLAADYFFTHPYSAWEKGTNENTNGLIRQYFPKLTDLRTFSEETIFTVAQKLNNRPRKSLGYKTPLQVFINHLSKNKSVALVT